LWAYCKIHFFVDIKCAAVFILMGATNQGYSVNCPIVSKAVAILGDVHEPVKILAPWNAAVGDETTIKVVTAEATPEIVDIVLLLEFDCAELGVGQEVKAAAIMAMLDAEFDTELVDVGAQIVVTVAGTDTPATQQTWMLYEIPACGKLVKFRVTRKPVLTGLVRGRTITWEAAGEKIQVIPTLA
jgi:hypothetical protein